MSRVNHLKAKAPTEDGAFDCKLRTKWFRVVISLFALPPIPVGYDNEGGKFGFGSNWLPENKKHMKFWRVEFIISDRKNPVENRFLFQEEFWFSQEKKVATNTSVKRYIHPLRRAMKWQAMMDRDPELSKTLSAKRLGISHVWVSQQLNLLKLPGQVQEKILKIIKISGRKLLSLNRNQNPEGSNAAFSELLKPPMSPQTGDKTDPKKLFEGINLP